MDKQLNGLFVVHNLSTCDTEVRFAGAYRTLEQAEKRLAWVEKHFEIAEGEDSWRIKWIPTKMNITDERQF